MFYDTEILIRKQLKYPPFCDIIVIGFSGLKEDKIMEISKKTYNYLRRKLENIEELENKRKENQIKIFKPMPAPIDKIQNISDKIESIKASIRAIKLNRLKIQEEI